MSEHLPTGWEIKPLSCAVTRIDAGTSVNADDRAVRAGEIGVLKVSSVSTGLFKPQYNKTVVASDIKRVSVSVRANTIIVSRSNTPELVGASVYVPVSIDHLYHSDKLWQVHVKEQTDSKFLAYVLGLKDVRKRLAQMASGSSMSMKNISQDRFLSLRLKFPPLSEQRRIVEILDEADAAVRTTEALIAAKLKHKRAWAERLLTGKVRFPEFAGAVWQDANLGEFFRDRNARYTGDTPPVVLSCSKIYGIVPQTDLFSRILASKDLGRYKLVEPGDLVFDPMLLWDASINFSARRGVVSPAYSTLQFVAAHADPRFFHYLFDSHTLRHVYKTISQGTNTRRKKATAADFLRIVVRVPALAEQQKIAETLSLMDEEIALRRRQLAALKAQKQGLMQKLLTGEVRVKEFAP